jgi:F420-non-reducing hydrogenase small subunit
MSEKPKVAFYWCASCGGCEEAVVDLGEGILDVVAAVDIVMWPVAMDFKRKDVEAMPDGSIVATFLNGAIRTTEQEEMAHLMRRKSQFMIAFGACAQLGGIPGLANMWDRKTIFERVYSESPSTVNPEGVVPQMVYKDNGHTVHLPGFYDTVKRLDQVVDVDYSVPGCPPTADLLKQAVDTLLSGKLPPKGSVLAPDRALCDECPRKDTKPDNLEIEEFKRPHQILIDHEKCLLAQGLLCLGPATRGSCGALCVKGNMPCTGCFGPTSRVKDFGAKALSGMASLLAAKDDATILKVIESVPDPVGSFYRYSLPASLLVRKKMEGTNDAR